MAKNFNTTRNVVMAFDPGKGKVRWHKADHRAACVARLWNISGTIPEYPMGSEDRRTNQPHR